MDENQQLDILIDELKRVPTNGKSAVEKDELLKAAKERARERIAAWDAAYGKVAGAWSRFDEGEVSLLAACDEFDVAAAGLAGIVRNVLDRAASAANRYPLGSQAIGNAHQPAALRSLILAKLGALANSPDAQPAPLGQALRADDVTLEIEAARKAAFDKIPPA